MSTYNILAFDGGGIRGVFTARLIENLAADVPGFLDSFQLFSGTSVGSANALALAAGKGPSEMVKFYVDHGKDIFGQRIKPTGVLGEIVSALSRIPGIRGLVGDLDNLFLAKWSNSGLHEALGELFGTGSGAVTLGQLHRKVALPALAVNRPRQGSQKPFTVPVVMDNFDGSEFLEVTATDAMMRSGAAPTYFESYQGFVDGGLVANNPSMAALAAALDPRKGAQDLRDVRMLSIGTGISPEGITKPQPLDWGIVQWGPIVFNVSSTSVSEFDTYNATHVLGPNYCRLNLVLEKNIPLDDAKEVGKLIDLADGMKTGEDYQKTVEFVRRNFAA